MELPFYSYNTPKPDRISTPEKDKDKKYHLAYGRYSIGAMNHPYYRLFQTKSLINWNFYQNRQWCYKEDIEAFLQDETGDIRNRVRWQRNIIQPLVQELIGNTIRTDFKAKAISVSEHVINRREQELSRLKFWSRQAQNASPEMKQTIKNNIPIGDSEDETEEIFENLWVDSVEKNINNLIKYIAEVDNNLDADKIEIARHLALSGLGIMKGQYINSKYIWKPVDPQFFGFDYGAQKKDLSDSEYMWELHFMDGASVIEKWQPKREYAEAIEKFGTEAFANYQSIFYWIAGGTSTRLPVFEVYWKDIQKQEYGWVKDPFGYEMITRINDESTKYTDKDLITPKEEYSMIEMDSKSKKTFRYVDVVRFCTFVATDYFKINNDIVLDWGVMPYQETNLLNPSRSELPYKCSCWDFHNGLILAPCDVAIDSQRLINRVISIAESRINNSSGDFDIIDRGAIDAETGEEGTLRAMRNSKPLVIDTRGRGVQNAITKHTSSMSNDIDMLFNISDRLRMATTDITGINEQLAGTQGNAHSQAIQAGQPLGTLANENFFYCISSIIEQVYQSNASRGKRIYIDSPRRLAIMTGDKGAQEIILTRDMNLEDFRVVVRRTGSEEMEKFMANQEMLKLYGAQLIQYKELVDWYNVATMDDIQKIMKDSYKRKQVASKVQIEQQTAVAQQNNQKQGELMQQAQNEKNTMIQLGLEKEQRDKEQRLKEISLRGMVTLMKTREVLRAKQRENEQKKP